MAEEPKNQPNSEDGLIDLSPKPTPTGTMAGLESATSATSAPTTPESRSDSFGGRAAPSRVAQERGIPAIRTLRSDIQEYTAKTKTSYFDILASAQKKRPQFIKELSVATRQIKFALVAISVTAVLALTIGGYILIIDKQTKELPPVARAPKPLIYGDNEQIIEYTGETEIFTRSVQSVLTSPQLSNEFTNLIIKKLVNEREIFFEPADLLAALAAEPPAELKSAISPPLTFGAVDTFGENETVLMFKITDYNRAFAGLLGWERTIIRDLRPILPADDNLNFGEHIFQDAVVRNNDARILLNLEGQPILAYTIFNRKLVVIVSSRGALEVVLDKLIISPPNL